VAEKTKIKNQDGLAGPMSEAAKNNPNLSAGLNGNNISEGVPFFDKTESEVVFKNLNNSWIVLGRDRPSTKGSGYGGSSATQCGSIDLVVGRMSSVDGGPKSDIWASPNFTSDAARIYISQRTNIDENFDLVDGGVGRSTGRSGIALKADAVRIIAREGIKLVTGTDKKNSQGGDINSTLGIDLIAGNDEAELSGPLQSFESGETNFLQPLVKGENLTAALDELATQLGDLATRFDKFSAAQTQYNTALSTHVHICTAPTIPSLPSVELIPMFISCNIKQFINSASVSWAQSLNLSTFKTNYLKPEGDLYICSRYNRTT
tara:strand:- start:759 stop:1715 length:957 start_codon:yes stop_codon:yes gene_type:complete